MVTIQVKISSTTSLETIAECYEPLGLERADWPRALGAATQIRLITNTVLSSIRSSS
jgi:hypothetical protein